MFLHGLIRDGRLRTYKVGGFRNTADLGTTYLDKGDFERHREAAGTVLVLAIASAEHTARDMYTGVLMCSRVLRSAWEV